MRRSLIAGLILIAIGVIFLLHNLGVLPVPIRELFRTWWPVILIIVGVSMLVPRKK